MTQLLQKEKSWGAKEIDARQRWLAEVANQVWRFRPPTTRA